MSHRPERRIPLARPSFDEREERILVEVLRSGWVAQGPRVEEFERGFARAVGAEHAVAVSSGTAALFLALHALGIGRGDEVLVPSLSFIASANAIAHTGATPVFVDVDEHTYDVDPAEVEAAMGPRTRAILPVHQLGMPADLDALEAIARRHGLRIVADSACAAGSRHRGAPVGSRPGVDCFSFHARKVLVTGEGGMITTDDGDLAARLRRLRHQGMSVSDLERHRAEGVIVEGYPELGYNFRLSDLQAAIGVIQTQKLGVLVERRRALAARYDAAFADVPELALPRIPDYAEPNYQSYIVRLPGAVREQRDALMNDLFRRGVTARRGLMAAHLEPPYRRAPLRRPLPRTEAAEAQTLVLPLYADLSHEDQDFVVDAVRASLADRP